MAERMRNVFVRVSVPDNVSDWHVREVIDDAFIDELGFDPLSTVIEQGDGWKRGFLAAHGVLPPTPERG